MEYEVEVRIRTFVKVNASDEHSARDRAKAHVYKNHPSIFSDVEYDIDLTNVMEVSCTQS